MNFACSSLTLETLDQKHLFGRTYDMDTLFGGKFIFLPRHFDFVLNGKGEKEGSLYAVLGLGLLGFPTPFLFDGMNEHGLMGALLYYPKFATYQDFQKEKLNVNVGFFLTLMLGSCKNVQEVCQRANEINLIEEEVYQIKLPLHFIFSDKSGEAVVIEPDASGLSVHRETIGVLTNSPNYEWHKQNLRNYLGMYSEAKESQEIHGFTVTPFGEGSGCLGLPGDYTPPSRFVRLAYLRNLIRKPKDEAAGVCEMFHLFDTVTIPFGVHKNKKGQDEGTFYSNVMCAESLTYYVSFYTNRRVVAISLEKEKEGTELKTFSLPEEEEIRFLN